jgi:DNA-binding CsgD family transcriptional regulator
LRPVGGDGPADGGAPPEQQVVTVDLRDATAQIAVKAVLAAAGYAVTDRGAATDADIAIVDLDAPCGEARCVVVVVAAIAAPCAEALDAVLNGDAVGAVTTRDMEGVPAMVAAARDGVRCVANDVVRLARLLPTLAPREAEVLAAVGTGLSVEDIAATLHLSVATVKRELSSLLRRVGARNRVELVLVARDLGLLDERGKPRRQRGAAAAPAAAAATAVPRRRHGD